MMTVKKDYHKERLERAEAERLRKIQKELRTYKAEYEDDEMEVFSYCSTDDEALYESGIQNLLNAIDIANIYDQISMVGLFTGMRQSEILGLRWKDVDLEYGTAYIRRQLQKDKVVHEEYGSKYFIGNSPKGKRNRMIDLAETIVEILKFRRKQQLEDKRLNINTWVGDERINSDLIFTLPNGKHLSHCTVLKNYKRLLKRSKLTPNRFHDLRHSYAVVSLQIGENLKTIQLNMGHRSEAFMLKKYGHMTKGMRKDSAERIQTYINQQSTTQTQIDA